jgi:hypothetical protein
MSKASNAFNGAPELALAIALPAERRATRFPTYPNIEKTATLTTLSTSTLSVGSGAVSLLTFFRTPVYPLWTRQGGLQYSQTMMWGFGGLAANDRNTLIFDSEPEYYSTSLSTMPYPILGTRTTRFGYIARKGHKSLGRSILAPQQVGCRRSSLKCSMGSARFNVSFLRLLPGVQGL